jgi:hypothetical protein
MRAIVREANPTNREGRESIVDSLGHAGGWDGLGGRGGRLDTRGSYL